MTILYKTQKLIAVEYLNTQNKEYLHLHILFNIGFALNRELFEFFRPSKSCSFSINYHGQKCETVTLFFIYSKMLFE